MPRRRGFDSVVAAVGFSSPPATPILSPESPVSVRAHQVGEVLARRAGGDVHALLDPDVLARPPAPAPASSAVPRAFVVAKKATPWRSFGVDTMRERSTDRAQSTATSTKDLDPPAVVCVATRLSPLAAMPAGAGRNMAGTRR